MGRNVSYRRLENYSIAALRETKVVRSIRITSTGDRLPRDDREMMENHVECDEKRLDQE